MAYSQSIKNLIDAFSRLPSVGQRTAERYVFYLLKSGKKDVGQITNALKQLITEVKSCERCWDFADNSPCALCADPKRSQDVICVVAEPQDVQALERTQQYNGTYHILRGTVSPDHDKPSSYLKIKELFERVKKESTSEVILALNHDLRGETTMMLLEKHLKERFPSLTISRLARGLPMGSDLQYADDITLGSALEHRTRS